MTPPEQAAPATARTRGRFRALGLALLAPLGVFLAALDPGLLTGEALLGAGTADLWGHAWGYGWVASSLAEGSLPYAEAPLNFPEGQAWWVVDLPVAVVLSPLVWLGGPALGWHGSLALRLGLAALALDWFLRRRGLSRALAGAGALVLCWGPVPRGLLLSCVPEGLSVLLAPAFGQLALDGLRGSRRATLGATLAGPLLVLEGGYSGLSAGLCGALALALALWEGRTLRALLGAALIAAPAAAVGLLQLRLMEAAQHRALTLPVIVPPAFPDWPAVMPGSSDLLVAFAHGWMLPAVSEEVVHRHVAYVGLPLLLLGLLAAWRHRGSRGLVLLGLVALVLSLGARLSWGGEVLLRLPTAALTEVGGSNTYRLASLAGVGLLAGALLGLPRRWRPLALALVFVDWLAAAPLSPGTVARPEGPVEVALSEVEGGVLDLPLDRDGQGRTGPFPQRTFYLQAVHGRPIASSLHVHNAAVRGLRTVRALEATVGAAVLTGGREAQGGRLRSLARGARARDLAALEALGFGAVSYDGERIPGPTAEQVRAFLLDWLGEPLVQEGSRMCWALRGPPAPSG